MRVPYLVSAFLLGITSFEVDGLTSAIPAVAENTLPNSKTVDVPEKPEPTAPAECTGKKCRKLAHRRALRRRSAPPRENPCPPHNPELRPPMRQPSALGFHRYGKHRGTQGCCRGPASGCSVS